MFSEKALRITATELNDVLGIEPPIDVKAKVGPLTEAVKEALGLITPQDKFTKATQAVIDELKEVGGEEGAAGDDAGAAGESTLKESVEAAETRSDLIEVAKANDEFKEIRGKLSSYKTSKELKNAMLDILSVLEDERQEKAEELHEKNVGSKPVRVGKEGPVKAPVTKERFAAKKSTGAERVDFLTPLITAGKYTKAELVEKASKEFPDVSISTLQTMLTDAKNPKYNKFKKLVVQAEDGVMSFKK